MAEVSKALEQKQRIILVDARPPSDFSSLHIPGSVSLPYYNLELVDRIPNDGTWVIAYCGCPHHASGEVVDALLRKGYKNAAVLDEGMFAWQKAGYPVVQAPGMAALAAPPVYSGGKPQPLPHAAHPGHDHAGHAHPGPASPPTKSPR
jgi:rhodanese-related sulfurtransferase